MIDFLYRVSRGLKNYGKPFKLALHRQFGKTGDVITIIDRSTGLSFECKKPADKMFGEIFHTRLYDVPLAPLRRGDVVIDVGANHGFFSCYAGFKGARVLAFEPQADTFELLARNIARHEQEGLVEAFPWAVTGADGTVQLYITDALGGGMSSVVPQFVRQHGLKIIRSAAVRSVSLPEIFRDFALERVRLLKLDCEGSELDIIRSLNLDIARKIDAIVLEIHEGAYRYDDLLDLILGLGIFHVSKPNTEIFGVTNAVVHAVNEDCIRRFFAHADRPEPGCTEMA